MDKYYGKHIIPDEGHVEEKEGEVWLGNIKPEEFSNFIWKTKRLGTNAYDADGKILRDQRPVFIQREEIEREDKFCVATDKELCAESEKFCPNVVILLLPVEKG